MDDSTFDRLVRTLQGSRTRRSAGAVLGALAARPLLGRDDADAKKKKKKKPKKPKGGGTTQPPGCTPRCNGCGGSDGCGGTCGCGSNQICHEGTCQTCSVQCNGDGIACGSRLSQKLLDGGTIYVCPGVYLGPFTVKSGKVIGAGRGDNPATSTILRFPDSSDGAVVSVENHATVELHSLRITKGFTGVGAGGGVRAEEGDLRITNCAIVENFGEVGGGISAGGTLRVTSSIISNNQARYGGGLYLWGDQPKFVTDSTIAENAATYGGGGLHLTSWATITIVGTEIRKNQVTTGRGGGVVNGGIPPSEAGGTINFDSSSRIVENTAAMSDGAIHNRRGTTNLNGATVSGNSAPQCTDVQGC